MHKLIISCFAFMVIMKSSFALIYTDGENLSGEVDRKVQQIILSSKSTNFDSVREQQKEERAMRRSQTAKSMNLLPLAIKQKLNSIKSGSLKVSSKNSRSGLSLINKRSGGSFINFLVFFTGLFALAMLYFKLKPRTARA